MWLLKVEDLPWYYYGNLGNIFRFSLANLLDWNVGPSLAGGMTGGIVSFLLALKMWPDTNWDCISRYYPVRGGGRSG